MTFQIEPVTICPELFPGPLSICLVSTADTSEYQAS